jgi:hypothetical protein
MNRFLIFFASLVLTFVTISSACSASASEWQRSAFGAKSGAGFGGGALTGTLAGTPSRLVSIEVIRL